MIDEEAYSVVVDVHGIIDTVRVVARYNPPMQKLVDLLLEQTLGAARYRRPVEDALRNGSTIFEALTNLAPKLANAIHDFVYKITNPHDSVITKNLAREAVGRTILRI